MFPKVTRLIPQRPPFLLVDAVVSCDDTDAVTSFVVQQDHLLVEDARLSVAGIVENMAQSCAARMGCVDWLNGVPIKIGYIGDVKDCNIVRRPSCGETLQTHVHIIEEVFNLMLAEVSVSTEGQEIATARMKIAMTDIVADLDN